MKMMELIIMDCMAKEGGSEADLVDIMAFVLPSTRAGICLNTCLMESTGVVECYFHSISNSKNKIIKFLFFRLLMVNFH